MYLFLKTYKRLSNVPGRPCISNCGIPAEKVSEFLDFHRKPVMQSSRSYIKDSGDFIRKIKDIHYTPSNVILVTAHVFKTLKNIFDKIKNQTISNADLD